LISELSGLSFIPKKLREAFWITYFESAVDVTEISKYTSVMIERIRELEISRFTPSMPNAISDMGLSIQHVVHVGEETFSLEKRARAVSVSRLLDDIHPID
jgi:hypothetical protein